MPIDPSQGSALAGGIPTAPSQQSAPPPEQAPQGGAVPTAPDGGSIVTDAISTLMKFAVAQREQGNPVIAEAMKPLIQAMTGGQPGDALPQQEPIEAAPAPQAVQGGQMPLNA